MTSLPANPSIQIVHLTRGSVVLAGPEAYACTNTADILATVAQLLPPDGSFDHWQPSDRDRIPPTSNSGPPAQPVNLVTDQAPIPSGASPERNPLFQRDNLLKLCDAWAQERITDEQFDEYLAQSCPDIGLEEAYMTRDSFGPPGTDQSQIQGVPLESHDV